MVKVCSKYNFLYLYHTDTKCLSSYVGSLNRSDIRLSLHMKIEKKICLLVSPANTLAELWPFVPGADEFRARDQSKRTLDYLCALICRRRAIIGLINPVNPDL